MHYYVETRNTCSLYNKCREHDELPVSFPVYEVTVDLWPNTVAME